MVTTSNVPMKKRSLPRAYRTVAWILPLVTSAAANVNRISRPPVVSYPGSFQHRRSRSILSIRGGSSYGSTSPGTGGGGNYDNGRPPANDPNYRYPTSVDGRVLTDESYSEPPVTASTLDSQEQETVQERLDQWRTIQLENSARMQESPRDAQGRLKLLTSIGKGSRAAIFFILMWRDVHLYETAATVFTTTLPRLLATVPLIVLFVTNMIGAIISLTSPSQATKKRLKAVLNLDKLVEVLLLVYSLVRLTVWPSRYTAREIYISNCFHSAFFLLQCQAFTRVSWDEKSAQPMSTYATAATSATSQPMPATTFQQTGTQEMPPRFGDEWNDAPSQPFSSQ